MFGITFRPGGAHVQPVIVWRPVAIPLSIIVSPIIDDLVLAAGSSESLSAVEHPCRIEHPPFVQAVHAHDVDIMSAVIAGIIPPSTVDPVDTGLRPGEGVAEPARQPPVVLPHAQFHTIALSFSGQSQSLQFNLTAERLAVAVVEHILDRPVIELLGAGGHLQSVWEPQKEQFVSRSVISNLQKEFSEEIGIKLTAKDVNIIGGFINTKTYELVILANIIISPELVPHIQEYAIGNFEEDTDGIYLGSFEETMNSYMIDASYFAGGNAAAITNFPYNDDIMIRFRKQFMSIPPAESHLHRV